MRHSSVLLVLWLSLLVSRPAAAAMICSISLSPFSFGNYIPGDATPLDVTGQIGVRCTGSPGTFVAKISPGGSGSFAQRRMLSGPFLLNYNFYLNPSHTAVWGDGTGGSQTTSGVKPRAGQQNFTLPIYGRVFPGQSVGAGTYSDNVLVTIVF
ncbi:MAG TPA: spore coat U domain-containing protein [Gammaproteobacteria bacterium]|nr:spore coat U domain-containing protein [Gammaproteobacteria bacterium]